MSHLFQYKIGGVYLQYDRRQNNGTTERAVEIPIAEHWFNQAKESWPIIEVGAVTPSFWAVSHPIVDPRYGGSVATSLFSRDYRGMAVLSISTIEHVDDGRYGLPLEGKTPLDAYLKIRDESAAFLITIPYGWEQGRWEVGALQQHLLSRHNDGNLFILTRTDDLLWGPSDTLKPYGPRANTVLVVEKGGLL